MGDKSSLSGNLSATLYRRQPDIVGDKLFVSFVCMYCFCRQPDIVGDKAIIPIFKFTINVVIM